MVQTLTILFLERFMKKTVLSVSVGLAMFGMVGQAIALCAAPSTRLNDPALTTALSGNTVCVAKAGGWENQEFHAVGGALIDWKLGTNTVDPTSQVGTWAIETTGRTSTMNHTYGTTTYKWIVFSNGGNSVTFCNGTAPVAEATIKSGQGACP
jgi:hypothetical protein